MKITFNMPKTVDILVGMTESYEINDENCSEFIAFSSERITKITVDDTANTIYGEIELCISEYIDKILVDDLYNNYYKLYATCDTDILSTFDFEFDKSITNTEYAYCKSGIYLSNFNYKILSCLVKDTNLVYNGNNTNQSIDCIDKLKAILINKTSDISKFIIDNIEFCFKKGN